MHRGRGATGQAEIHPDPSGRGLWGTGPHTLLPPGALVRPLPLCPPRTPASPPWLSGGAPCSRAAQRTPKDAIRGPSPCRRPHPDTVPTVPTVCQALKPLHLHLREVPPTGSPTLVELRVGSMDRVGPPDPWRPLLGPWRATPGPPPPTPGQQFWGGGCDAEQGQSFRVWSGVNSAVAWLSPYRA